ncbi:MAG: acyl-CoA dehydrogenase family protein, partial [Thermodesulfobacteriota bacterium]
MIAGTDKELKMMDKASAEFARKALAPERQTNDAYPFGPFFYDVVKNAYDLDFFHVTLPEACNGIGQSIAALCVVLYNICRTDSSLGGIIFTNAAAQELMLAAGAQDRLAALTESAETVHEVLLAAPVFAHPADMDNGLSVREADGGYRLSGQAAYVVAGNIARHAVVFANTADADGCGLFLVDLSHSGIAVSDPVHSLGLHACPAVDIAFHDAPAELMGDAGAGCRYFDRMCDRLSAAAAAMSAGIMKGAYDEAAAYAKGRYQGGRAIVDWSGLRMILSEMAISVKTAEALVSRACQAVDA